MAIITYSYKKDKNKKLSTNFTVGEFACIDYDYGGLITDVIKIDTQLVEYLQTIRDYFGKPLTVTCQYRPEPYNSQIGGAYGSYHTLGRACDFYIHGVSVDEIAKFAESLGILGIGCYKDDLFVHIDTRTTKFFWYNQCCTETNTFGGAKLKEHRDKVKLVQNWMNKHFKSNIKVNGVYKSEARKAVIKAYQHIYQLKEDGKLSLDLLSYIPTFRGGEKGVKVALVQVMLILKGCDNLDFNGTYDAKTKAMVKAYQKAKGLEIDGICGIQTAKKLLS